MTPSKDGLVPLEFDVVTNTSNMAAVEDCELNASLSSESSPGFHVLCLSTLPSGETQVVAFKHGLRAPAGLRWLVPKESSLTEFVMTTKKVLLLPPRRGQFQESELFSHEGRLVQTAQELASLRVVYYFEGGQFMYPSVEVGYKRAIGELASFSENLV